MFLDVACSGIFSRLWDFHQIYPTLPNDPIMDTRCSCQRFVFGQQSIKIPLLKMKKVLKHNFQGINIFNDGYFSSFHHIADICHHVPPISRSYLASIVCIGLAHQRSPKVKTKPAILLMMSMVNFDDYNVYISLLLER